MLNLPLNITNPDITKRKPLEWAQLYHIKLMGKQKVPNKLMNEYEFAWHYINNALSFVPIANDAHGDTYDNFNESNLRANELVADIYVNATLAERNTLREKYIDTSFIRKQLQYI